MADVLSRGSLFPEALIPELISKVKGHSALAALCGSTPIPFNGLKEFTFTLDKEVDIVAENGAKTKGGVTVLPVTIVPIKFEYGARVSDEFRYGSDEVRLQYLSAFTEGFARKLARGLDIAAFHGLNPRTGAASAVIGSNHFDAAVQNLVTYDAAHPDENLDDAIAAIQAAEGDVTGMALSPAFGAAMAKVKVNGLPQYPEFRFGQKPASFAGIGVDINNTVTVAATGERTDHAVIGDFASAFKWGYAKQIPLEVIEYGNPDNDQTLGDLKGHNQVYLRCEAYLGWGILDAASFAVVYA